MLCLLNNFYRGSTLWILVILLTACGGGGGNGNDEEVIVTTPVPDVMTGVFLDSLVSGINYSTDTQSGTTNTAGEYQYVSGEQITFSIGDLILGTATAGPVVTPLLLVDGAMDATDERVTNIVRLLLTLDSDNNPDNGIEIPASAHTAASGLSLDFSSPTFDQDVQTFIETVQGTGTLLVAANDAQTHFDTSLKTSWGTMTWTTDCWGQLCN